MARIQITVPDTSALAVIHIPVRITDINYGNHLGNDALVSIIHEARMRFLQQHQLSELDAGGIGLIMADLAVSYKKESFYGDQLSISIYADAIARASFELIYKITTQREGKEITTALCSTGMVGYDYKHSKITSLPDALLEVLRGNKN